MNDLEMNELISSVIYDSDNISPVVNIKDGTGETVTVDITKLKPETDVFIDGRLSASPTRTSGTTRLVSTLQSTSPTVK